MMPYLSRVFALGCLLMLCPALVHADERTDAETALAQGRAFRAATIATRALEAGTRRADELVPLLAVLARARAAQQDADATRELLTRLLALYPSFRLGDDRNVVLHSAFLEARGFWSEHPTALDAVLSRGPDDALVLQVTDPAGLVARVRVRVRAAGEPAFREVTRAPEARMELPVPGLDSDAALDYSLALLDASGNRLWEQGSDDAPAHLNAVIAAVPPVVEAPQPLRDDRRIARRVALFTGGGVAAGLAAGALIGAAVANRSRQSLARRWNEADCDGAGDTRAERCREVRSRLDETQTVAVGLYTLSGVALLGSVAMLWLAPSLSDADARAPVARTWDCFQGPGRVGVACAGRF